MGKKKANGYNNAKLQEEGIGIVPAVPSKNPFVRFWDWLSGIPRDIRAFFISAKCAN